MQLHEKYRPADWADVVGQDKAVRMVRGIIDGRGAGGRAYWLSGASGTGKTTIARLIAGQVADGLFVTEFDSGDEFNAEALEEMRRCQRLTAWGKGGRAWIINEAHGLRAPIIRGLLGVLEDLSPRSVVIFTTTRDGEDGLFEGQIDAHPLLSRCLVVPLTNQGLARTFAERARTIAQAEGLDGLPIERYVRLAADCRNNLRAMLQRIEAGAMAKGGAE